MSSLPSQKLSVFGGPLPAAPTRRTTAPETAGVREAHAFAYLLEALVTAQTLGLDQWDFALDLAGLRTTGATDSELRWAIVMGYVEHRTEVTAPGAVRRAFDAVTNLQLTERSCFVLTPAGEHYARSSRVTAHARLFVPPHPVGDGRAPTVRFAGLPAWDATRRLLHVGNVVVKEYRVPAANQELILAAFQELGWPLAIDDPLPSHSGLDRKRRLHDTINSLNRNQRQPLLKFRGKGDGLGVSWEFHQIATRSSPDSV